LAIYLGLLVYLIIGWAKLKKPFINKTNFKTTVTILIAARNEEEKIHLTIEDILKQTYPKHLTEIIIVDDHSTDKTSDIIKSYESRGVKLLQLKEDKPLNSYKKKAISEAIKLSTGELMVATDADCRMGIKWLESIVGYYEQENLVFISAPVTYFEEKSLFERLQTLEFGYLIGIGAAFIGQGRASNCNGANLAYRKDVFYDVGGFAGIDDIASGDDELLLQKVAKRYPNRIGFLKHFDSVVFTHAKHTVNEFLEQRHRWASKSVKYKNKLIVAMAVAIWLFNVSLITNLLVSIFISQFFQIFAIQFLLKYLFELVFLFPISSFFKRPNLPLLLIVLIPIHVVYFVYIGIKGYNNSYIWKGRMVR
jgi:cellulose synthase/poly-beta-1,6-N-acetylglucosamine synthase-like glycosyltransferase